MSAQNVPQNAAASVRVASPMRIDVLSRLLVEYSDRLQRKTNLLDQASTIRFNPRDEETQRDVEYLSKQTSKLVDKASAYREHSDIDEGERFELELGLFDAEDALRYATKVLRRFGRST